jgi:hypothetical protein
MFIKMIRDYLMNKFKNQKGFAVILPLVIIAVVGIVGYSAHLITKKDDTAIEEMAEDYIKSETGKDVDLTPDSKEMNDA